MSKERDFKREKILLVVCLILLIIVNYGPLDSMLEDSLFDTNSKTVRIIRVVDGDTVVYNNGKEKHVRLLGVNAPEKGERFYSEARDFMKKKVFNKTVELVYGSEKTDRYGRELAYIFHKGENINLKLVRKGLGNFYFPSGRDSYYGSFVKAWKDCLNNERKLCKSSSFECSGCIELKGVDKFEQKVVFYNSCKNRCDLTKWSIKDEGRKKFVFPDFILDSESEVIIKVEDNKYNESSENVLYWEGYDYVWTSSGDTLFLRDSEGRLVLWKIID